MTATDSLTLSASLPLPSDPAELQERLDGYIADLAVLMEDEMVRIVEAMGDEALALVAAASPQAQWSAFVDETVGPYVATIYREGALNATISSTAPPHITALMAPVINQQAVDYTRVATNRIVGAGNQMWGNVRSELTNTIALGGTTEDLKSKVEQITGYSEFRSDTIARTEVMGAYNHGDNDAAASLGEFGPVEKQWLAAIDGRTRESHIEANGQVVPFKEDFIVGGSAMRFPGEGPPEEVINCRCVVLHLYPGDERPDGSLAGDDPLDREAMSQPAPPEQDTVNWIKGQLADNPKMTGQQLLDQYKASGVKITRQDFYRLVREAKSGVYVERGVAKETVKATKRVAEKRVAKKVATGTAKRGAEMVAEKVDNLNTYTFGKHIDEVGERRFAMARNSGRSGAQPEASRIIGFKYRGVNVMMDNLDGEWLSRARRAGPDDFDRLLLELRRNNTRLDETLAGLDRALPEVPQGTIRQVNLFKGRNPQDEYWAKRYNRPGFESAATGGGGEINVYTGRAPSLGTMRHEIGHNVEQYAYNGAQRGRVQVEGRVAKKMSESPQWAKAIKSDARSYPRDPYDPRQPRALRNELRFTGHKPTPDNPAGITTYGQSSPGEDFAESFRLYLMDKDLGSIGYQGETFAELFPARAKLIDKVLAQAKRGRW